MSRAVQVDGHLGPVFAGLGEHVANRTGGSAVAYMFGGRSALRPGVDVRGCFSSTTWDETHQQVPRSGTLVPWPVNATTCGGDGVPCMEGRPRSSVQMGLAGLGTVESNLVCSGHTAVLQQMEPLLAAAETRGDTSVAYQQAKVYFDSMQSMWSRPLLPSTCDTEIAKATQLYNALAATVGAGAFTPPPAPEYSESNVGNIVKWVAIGAVAIAGAYALGPIFRGIGGLIPRKGR